MPAKDRDQAFQDFQQYNLPTEDYGFIGQIERFGQNLKDSAYLDTIPGQVYQGIQIDPDLIFDTFDDDPNYNVYRDEDWRAEWPGDPEELLDVRSRREYLAELKMARLNDERRTRLEENDALVSRILPQFIDPINYLPIPAFKGAGFLVGGLKGGASFTAIAAAQEGIRTQLDKTDTFADSASIVGFSGGIGTVLGTTIGGFSRSFSNGFGETGTARTIDGVLRRHLQNVPELSHNDQVNQTLGAVGVDFRILKGAKQLSVRDFDFIIDKVQKAREDQINLAGPDTAESFLARERNIRDLDEVLDQLKVDRDRLSKFGEHIQNAKNTLIKNDNKIKILARKRANLDASNDADALEISKLDKQIEFFRDRANVLRESISGFEKAEARVTADRNFGQNDLGLKAMPLGLERIFGKGRQFPLYSLIHNKFVGKQETEELGQLFQLSAWELHGTPDLLSAGGHKGASPGASVMMRAFRHQAKYQPVSDKIGKDYMELVMGLSSPGKVRQTFTKFKEGFAETGKEVKGAIPEKVRQAGATAQEFAAQFIPNQLRRNGAQDIDDLNSAMTMTYREYREMIGEWMNSPTKTKVKLDERLAHLEPERRTAIINSIENNAKAIERDVHNPLNQDARRNGIFMDQQNVERSLKAKRIALAGAEGRLRQARQEPPSAAQVFRVERYKKDINDLKFQIEDLESKKTRFVTDDPDQGGFYFHTLYDSKKIEADVDGLRNVIQTHVAAKFIRRNGVTNAADRLEIAAESEEILLAMRREARFGDSMQGINPGSELARLQGRKKVLEEALEKGETRLDDIDINSALKVVNRRLDERIKGISSAKRSAIASPLIGRTLDIPREELIPWLVTDVDRVLTDYTRKMGTAVEMAKMFGDIDMNARLWEIEDAFRALPDELQKKHAKTYKKHVEDAEHLRDMVHGTYGMPTDPSSYSVRIVNAAKNMSAVAHMGKAVISAFGDSGKIVMAQGLERSFGLLYHNIQNLGTFDARKEMTTFQRGSRDVRSVGVASDLANLATQAQRADLGASQGITVGERALNQLSKGMFFLNLLTLWTDHAKRFAGILGSDQLVRDAEAWTKGKLTPERKADLAQAGMTEKLAFLVNREWQKMQQQTKNGLGDRIGGLGSKDTWRTADSDRIRFANLDEWSDQVVADEFRAVLATVVDNAVLTPTQATKFKVMNRPVMSAITQYMSFGTLALQSIAGSALQRRNADALAGLMSMVTIGYVADSLTRPDYIDMDLDEKLLRAVERSGALGILTDINSRIEIVSGNTLGLRPLLGMDAFIENPDPARKAGAILGPAASQWGSLVWAFSSEDATNSDKARAIRYMFPYNQLLWTDSLFTGLQSDLEDVFDYLDED